MKLKKMISSSISRRLFCYFAVFGLLVLVILETAQRQINYTTTRNMVEAFTRTQADSLMQQLEAVFEDAMTVSRTLQQNALFQSRLRKRYLTQAEMFSDELESDMELSNILSGHTDIAGVYLLGLNQFCSKSNAYSFLYSTYFTQSWYSNALSHKSGTWYGTHDASFVIRITNSSCISYVEPFIDRATANPNGVIVTEIDISALQGILGSAEEFNGMFLLMDPEGDILCRAGGEWAGDEQLAALQQRIRDAEITGEDISILQGGSGEMMICSRSGATGWVLAGVVPREYITRGSRTMLQAGAAAALVVLLLAILIGYLVSRRFTRPIIQATNAMSMAEQGDLSVQVKVAGDDEIARLGTGFNHMVTEMNRLMDSIYTQQEMLRRSEFKALQSQINPHFLYNSLDSIGWLIRMGQQDDAVSMLQNLSRLFRIALSKGHDLIPVEAELKHLESYIAIQRIRYSKKFTCTMDIDDAVRDCVTLKLILQPLVENCIYHGLSMEKPLIHIDVSARPDGKDLLFTVSDDGAGMSPDKLEELRANVSVIPGREGVSRDSAGGYGLANINSRIRVYFGEEYGMVIDSTEGEGTAITLRIPQVREQESEEKA